MTHDSDFAQRFYKAGSLNLILSRDILAEEVCGLRPVPAPEFAKFHCK